MRKNFVDAVFLLEKMFEARFLFRIVLLLVLDRNLASSYCLLRQWRSGSWRFLLKLNKEESEWFSLMWFSVLRHF